MEGNEIVGNDGGIDINALADATHEVESSSSEGTQEVTKEVSDDDSSDVIDDLMDMQEGEDESEADEDSTETQESEENEESEFEDEESRETQEEVEREVFKLKDGEKDLEIPKDAKVELKIDGKMETMTLQEALNNASGSIHVERGVAKLGRDRKEFEDAVKQVNVNAKRIIEAEDPYEMCEIIGEMQGKDGDEVYGELMEKTIREIERLRGMTPEQIEKDRKDRKRDRLLKEYEAKEEIRKKEAQKLEDREVFHKHLESQGLEVSEFEEAIAELQEKASKGEEFGFGLDSLKDITQNDIVDYVIAKKSHERVVNGIKSVDSKLLTQPEFIKKVQMALVQTESLNGGQKLSPKEVSELVRKAFELDNKALSESLSRKVKNSKKTKSEAVNSEEQEEDGDFSSLDDFLKNGL